MNRSLRAATAELLERHGLTLAKLRGQHLLVDAAALARIVAAAGLRGGESVLEIGPGTGILTDRLLAAGAHVTAIELDQRMATLLRERFAGAPRFTLIVGDALAVLAERRGTPLPPDYVVVANLPYQITTPLLWTLIGPDVPATRLPVSVTVLIQREVADRLLARPPDMNLLALLTQTFGEARRVADVPAGAFLPPPRVTSSVVHLARAPIAGRAALLKLARAGFAAPRRKLLGNLAASGLSRDAAAAALKAAKIDADVRAERLDIAAWQRLSAALDARGR